MATLLTSQALESAARLVVELATGTARTPITAAATLAAASFDTTIEELWELVATGDTPGVWAVAAGDPTTPPELLERIVERASTSTGHTDVLVLATAAGNPSVTEVARWTLLEHPNAIVRCALAEASGTDLALLQALAHDTDTDVCQAVAEHRNTDGHIRRRLAHHDHSEVRMAVASSWDGELDILEMLSRDESEHVRSAVADVTPALAHLDRLADDDCADVRMGVAKNGSTPYDLLRKLAEDPEPFVASAAKHQM